MTSVARVLPAFRNLRHSASGRCPVCGRFTLYVVKDTTHLRETIVCVACRSSARNRLVALELLTLLEASSLRGAARAGLSQDVYIAATQGALLRAMPPGTPRLTTSDFLPDVAPGAPVRDGATCQNLESLTYPDESFDVVVTEDVLEHVRDPDACFSEIARVLRPGGRHIFTAPIQLDRPLLTRVDTTGPEDVRLMPDEWHGDSIRGRILAYRTFGGDLFADLTRFGFQTRLRLPSLLDRRAGVYNCAVLISTKAAAPG